MFLRRDFIKAGAAFAFAGNSFRDFAWARVNRIVDAHCHVFNGADLPIVGFLEKVALPAQSEFKQYATQYGHVIRFVVRFMAKWIRANAVRAADEIVLLDKIKARTARPRTANQIAADEVRYLSGLVDELMQLRIKEKNFSLGERVISAYLPGVTVGLLHREANPILYSGSGYLDDSDGAFDSGSWQSPEVLAQQIYDSGKGPISHFLRWGLMFTRCRFELVDELQRIHGPRLQLLTPAVVDYSSWLNDSFDVNLAGQVEAMGRIARRPGAVRVHGYAPFDPLREALHRYHRWDKESPLALAKRAVTKEGFIGVKLYPPMGFLPFDNTKTLFAGDYPRFIDAAFRKTMNASLDAALADLYSWCAAEQVPILAHARESNGSEPEYAERASPSNWAAVAKSFPGIRISLAHFGDFHGGFESAANPHPKLDRTWEWKMAALVRDHPESRVYIDLSYLDLALRPQNDSLRTEINRMFGDMRKEFPGLAERMLFGTDWIMFGKEELFDPMNRNGTYADRVEDFLSGAGYADAIGGIMFSNAGDFLGLTLANTVAGNRSRLNQFYKENNLSATWLNNFPVR